MCALGDVDVDCLAKGGIVDEGCAIAFPNMLTGSIYIHAVCSSGSRFLTQVLASSAGHCPRWWCAERRCTERSTHTPVTFSERSWPECSIHVSFTCVLLVFHWCAPSSRIPLSRETCVDRLCSLIVRFSALGRTRSCFCTGASFAHGLDHISHMAGRDRERQQGGQASTIFSWVSFVDRDLPIRWTPELRRCPCNPQRGLHGAVP